MKKQAWTAILLWMALFSFTLSAQEGGGNNEITINLSNSTELTDGSYTIRATGTYHFTGTYSGNPSAVIESSEGTAVISVAAGIEGDVTIILEDVDISLTDNQQCPLSARNATGKVIVQLKGTNTLASTYSGGGGQCPALWAPETSGVELIIEKSSGTETGSLTATAEGAQDAPGIGSMSREGSQITINSGTIKAIGGANAAGIGGGNQCNGGTITILDGTITATGGIQGAGIGGGNGGNGGTITISGGTVTATDGKGGAGIGGGEGGAGGTITISGENTKVTAQSNSNGAGIGGGNEGAGGKITISGGEVQATGGLNGAGIGGGSKDSNGNGGDGGTITISGGNVTAKSDSNGAGIGGGSYATGGKITISGGTVTAKGGNNGAGIGGGEGGAGGTITISGGTVTANGGGNGAGIGGGQNGNGGTIMITGGTVQEAKGGANAAGIGGGKDGDGGTIILSGGTVTANGGNWGAGIGGGYKDNNGGNGGTIKITGGTVKATGDEYGAGIGGGFYGAGGEITISGESTEVTAEGGNQAAGIGGGNGGDGGTITISGGTVEKAEGGNGGAGIGGGYNSAGGTITISGSSTTKVTAKGGKEAAGIGGGYGEKGAGGTITIKGGTVTAKGGAAGAAGIGGCRGNSDGTITITGGTVTAINGTGTTTDTPDIKGNTVIVGPDATVKKDENGTDPVYNNDANGFVFEENATSAEMKGTATLSADITIGNGQTLTIQENASLTIEENVTLTNDGTITNKGTITIEDNGKITNNSTITNEGTIKNEGKIEGTGTVSGGTVLTKLIESMITIDPDSYPYTGSAVKPTSVTVGSYEENTDYTLEYTNNINAGTAYVTVTPTDKDHGTLYGEAVSKEFTINKETPNATDFTFSQPTDLTYDGQAKTANVAIKEGITGMGEITINYYNGGTLLSSAPADAGTYTVKISVTDGTNFTAGSDITVDGWTFTIAKATPIATDFTFTQPTDLTYNGQEKTANVQANSDITGMGTVTKTYYGADNNVCQPINAGTYTVMINVANGTNFTTGSDITADNWKFEITKAMPTFAAWTVSDKVYDGTPISGVTKPTLTGIGNTTISANEVTLTYYLSDGTTQTTATNSGAESEGAAPVWAGNYQVKASFAGNENFEPAETSATFSITPANATLSFAQPTLTITQGDAVPANALTKPGDCTVNYTSSEPTVATVDAATGMVTVVGVGTTTITATAEGNYTGTASYTLTVNSSIPPYIPPTPDPDPIYYTVTIPTEVAGAIIHGGGTHEVEEYTYYTFRIELDPNGNGEYPTVTKGYWWDTLTPDGQGNYSVYVTGDTQITIGEVPTNSYDYYQVTLPTDSVAEADDQYWSGDYIEVTGASSLRAAEEASLSYQAPFGTTVTLRPIETERRKFLQWEDGSKQKERTLTLRDDQEIKALWQRISPTGIEAIAAGSVIRGERGQLYIEVPEPCDVTLYTYGGVPVRVARLAAGANRLANLNAGLYLVKLGAAQAVPVRVR